MPAPFHDVLVLNGDLTPTEEATIPVLDDGLLRGDGVFEAIRLYAGVPFALDEHLERLAKSASVLQLPADTDALREDCAKLLPEVEGKDAVLRAIVTRGGNRIVFTHDLLPRNATIRLAVIEHGIVPGLIGAKTLSYAANMLATRLAKERGFDEGLMIGPEQRVLEAPRSAFMWFEGDSLKSTDLETGILDSITRRRIAQLRDVDITPAKLDDLAAADECFIADTPYEITPVSEIEGIKNFDAPGNETASLSAELSELIRKELD